MLTERNNELIHHARRVYLKPLGSITGTWQKIYATPSSIRWTSRARRDAAGTRVETSLVLDYPGMGQEQFAALDALVCDRYALHVESDHRELFELASSELPAAVEYNFQDFGTQITFSVVAINAPRYLVNLSQALEAVNPQTYPITLATTT